VPLEEIMLKKRMSKLGNCFDGYHSEKSNKSKEEEDWQQYFE